MTKQKRSFSKSIKRGFNFKNRNAALLILMVPIVGIIDLIEYPLNLIIGIFIEIVFIIYIAIKIKIMYTREKKTKSASQDMNTNTL